MFRRVGESPVHRVCTVVRNNRQDSIIDLTKEGESQECFFYSRRQRKAAFSYPVSLSRLRLFYIEREKKSRAKKNNNVTGVTTGPRKLAVPPCSNNVPLPLHSVNNEMILALPSTPPPESTDSAVVVLLLVDQQGSRKTRVSALASFTRKPNSNFCSSRILYYYWLS